MGFWAVAIALVAVAQATVRVPDGMERFEFRFEFNTTAVASNQNHGVAYAQMHVTSVIAGSLMYSQTNYPGGEVVFRTSTNSSGSAFFARGNITFPDGFLINIEASDNGQAFQQGNISYGAVPYLIKGGTGPLKDAIGSAADVFVSDGSSPQFTVLVIGVFYVPQSGKRRTPRPFATPFSSEPPAPMQRRSVGPYSLTLFALDFISQGEGTSNYAFSWPQQITVTDYGFSQLQYLVPYLTGIFYDSKTGSPAPNKFNESGRVFAPTDFEFQFTSTTDGTVIAVTPDLSMGSIAYHIHDGSGSLKGGFGSMVDVFESHSESLQFPIRTFGVIFTPN